ncbi:MAG: HAD family hydrolase [Clostridia bacterium]|nr:HAD family hydrolase [Clostridia bacterium]
MVKLCIFDLDGTVLDTVGTIAHYGNGALVKHGIEPIETRQYNFLAGKGARILVRGMLEYRNCYSEELFERVFADYNEAYNKDVTHGTTVFEGLCEVLDALKARGIKLAIVSNKPDFAAQTVVNKIYGEGYFDFVTGQREGIALKPDPAAVLAVMERFGATREECVYVGDTGVDMETGKNAGLYTVGVLWGFRGREELKYFGADVLVERPPALYDCILTFERSKR